MASSEIIDWRTAGDLSHMARRTGRNDDVRGRLDPLAGVVDATEGVHGTNNGVGSRVDKARAFNQVAESETNVAVTPLKEIGRMGVTKNGGAAHLVFNGDVAGRMPVDEFIVYGVAFRMPADGAAALVVGGAGAIVSSGRAALPDVIRLGFGPAGLAASALFGRCALDGDLGGRSRIV